MEKYLPKNIGYIATHPLFGPDSFQTNKNLKMMAYPEKDIYNLFNFWKQFFSGQGIEIINIDLIHKYNGLFCNMVFFGENKR